MSARYPEIPLCYSDASASGSVFSHMGSYINSIGMDIAHSPNYASFGCGKLTLEQDKVPASDASHPERKSERSAYFVKSD